MSTRRQPLFTALEANYVSSGLTPDNHTLLQPLWESAQGVQFRQGKVLRRRPPRQLLWQEGQPIRGISQQFLSNGDKVVWIISGTELWRWDFFSKTKIADIAGLGQVSPYADFVHFGDWTFVNWGVGQPLFHQGSAGVQTIAQLPTDLSQMLKVLNYVMALGTGTKRTSVSWPSSRDINNWTPERTNDAGTLGLEYFDGPIVAGIRFGQQLLVFNTDQVALISFIGAPFYFGQRPLFDSIGVVGKQALCTDGQFIYGMGRDGAWQMNLGGYQYIDETRIQEYFQDNVNWGAADNIIVARNDNRRMIDFHFPMRNSSEINESWCFDPISGAWSRIPTVTFQQERKLTDFPLIGDIVGKVYELEAGGPPTQDLALKTKPLLLQGQSKSGITESHIDIRIDEFDLLLHEAENVQVRIGSSNTVEGPFTYGEWEQASTGTQTYTVQEQVPSGAYWQLEFRSQLGTVPVVEGGVAVTTEGQDVIVSDPVTDWRFNLQGFMLFGNVEGTRDVG